MQVEFRSHDSDSLDRVAELMAQVVRDQNEMHRQVLRVLKEIQGSQARIQIPTPHVAVAAAKAPNVDVQVEPPPPADVTVNVPEAQVTLAPNERLKRLVPKRDDRGFIESIEEEWA